MVKRLQGQHFDKHSVALLTSAVSDPSIPVQSLVPSFVLIWTIHKEESFWVYPTKHETVQLLLRTFYHL